MIKEEIQNRYSNEIESTNLGCANLTPFLKIKKSDIILDLGCGSGKFTSFLAKRVPEGFVYGIDLTEKMIMKAKNNKQEHNIDFLVGDIHNLPYEKEKFDIIVSNCVINHSTEKQKVFKEIFRTLKINGYFLIADVMAINRLPKEISENPQNISECWGGAIPKEDYIEIVSEIGFKKIEQLNTRKYKKNRFLLESIILKGVKKD